MAAQANGAAATVAATGYTLVVPDDWFSIVLDPERTERDIARLVNRQFAGIDNAPHLKAQARRDLADQAAAARQAGGVEMFLSLTEIAGVPVAGSLTTYLVPPPADGTSVDDLAAALAGDGQQVTVADLPAGRAVRIVRDADPPPQYIEDGAPSGSASPLGSREVQVLIPVPGGQAWLLLAFAAPLPPLASAMTGLFDAVSQTLRWSR